MKIFTTLLSATASTPGLVFEPKRFIEMLEYMGKGMLVIFVIIGVIVLATTLINKLFSGKKKQNLKQNIKALLPFTVTVLFC